MKTIFMAALALMGVGATCVAQAQSDNLTIFGSLDEYLNYMTSSSGRHLLALEDGEFLRSRIGLKGREDRGGGYATTFLLEQGLNATNGAQADASRLFDRQAWVGLATPYGEFRAGRQNTAVMYRGDYIDPTSRTLGSVVNAFGVPSRYDNDLSFRSMRYNGLEVELHASLPGTTAGVTSQGVYQAALEYYDGVAWRAGYAGVSAKAPAGSAQSDSVRYHDFYANYDYGKGKVYATFIRSNNSTASAGLNNAGLLLGSTGTLVTGTDANVKRFYNVFQAAVDYFLTPELRLAALLGRICDQSGAGHDAQGGAIAGYYALSRRTQLIAMIETLNNDTHAGFRPSGSAGLNPSFTAAADVNGQSIRTMTMGMQHKF